MNKILPLAGIIACTILLFMCIVEIARSGDETAALLNPIEQAVQKNHEIYMEQMVNEAKIKADIVANSVIVFCIDKYAFLASPTGHVTQVFTREFAGKGTTPMKCDELPQEK